MKKNVKRAVTFLILSVVILVTGFVTYEYLELKQPGIIVLLYHRVSEKGGGKYVLRPQEFAEQLKYLKTHGYRTILPKEILEKHIHTNLRKTVILTFDDGTEDHYKTVYPALKKYGFEGVFFIITKYINSPGSLTDSQISEMSRNNMEIGSHSYSHPFLDELSYSQISYELKKSKEDLEAITGNPVTSFAAPGGWFDDRAVTIAQRLGYNAFFSCEIGTNDLRKHPFIYKRIEISGRLPIKEFEALLQPSAALLEYKVIQSLKKILHDLVGSENYKNIGKLL